MKEDKYYKRKISMNNYNAINSAILEKERIDREDYARVIDKLMYIIIYTRPNIAFALRKLSQYISNLTIRYN